jgi:hypothetical protein
MAEENQIGSLEEDYRWWQGMDERALLEFNKTIVTFATAILAASIAFVKDIYAPKGFWDTALLVFSWIPFFIAIFCVLQSFHWHRQSTNERVALTRVRQENGDPAEYVQNVKKYGNRAGNWSRWSGITFVIGLALLAFFVTCEMFMEAPWLTTKTNTKARPSAAVPCSSAQNSSGQCPEKSLDFVRKSLQDSTKIQ